MQILSSHGLGEKRELPYRTKAHPVAHKTRDGERPTAMQQYDSIGVKNQVEYHDVVLVDDIIKGGSTVMGAANRLADEFPNVKVRVFVAMRALWKDRFSKIMHPYAGMIRSNGVNTSMAPS